MDVRNEHRRVIGAPDALTMLLASLGGPQDRLWPGDRWPPLRLDRPLHPGARGGHGPIRYRVEVYEPGRLVRFRFERPRGFHGFHEFRVDAVDGRPGELVHVLEARMTGTARATWPLVIRPLHDALIEDALDNAQRIGGRDLPHPAVWSRRVRLLRRALSIRRSRRGAARKAITASRAGGR